MKSPMWIDGSTYVLIAVCGALTSAFGSDESAKWIEPKMLFWMRTTVGAIGAGLLAIKMYRSTGFANHLSQQAASETNGSTVITTQIDPQPPIVTQGITKPPAET